MFSAKTTKSTSMRFESIAFDFEQSQRICACCDESYPTIQGMILTQDKPVGAFLLALHSDDISKPLAHLIISLADPIGKGKPIAFAIHATADAASYRFAFSDWPGFLWENEAWVGTHLNRSASLKSPRKPECLAIAADLFASLPLVSYYFHQPIRKGLAIDGIVPHWQPSSDQAADAVIYADLSPWKMPGAVEKLWARKISARDFEICSIPFFTYGIALGDVVRVGKNFFITKTIKKSGLHNLRLAATELKYSKQVAELAGQLARKNSWPLECLKSGYHALSIPQGIKPETLPLAKMTTAGKLSFEID
jgi:hypothetical protein